MAPALEHAANTIAIEIMRSTTIDLLWKNLEISEMFAPVMDLEDVGDWLSLALQTVFPILVSLFLALPKVSARLLPDVSPRLGTVSFAPFRVAKKMRDRTL